MEFIGKVIIGIVSLWVIVFLAYIFGFLGIILVKVIGILIIPAIIIMLVSKIFK
jgi:hypothetical protein